ncbi:MAG TPA: DUF2203 domain-containing protein [Gemmatimonadaceae bacterium]|nr:DUF2203 domain-containing protein [Gemmatimonadaceae bacterium]
MPFPQKLFTPEQADRTLPLVRRIVHDIVAHYRRWAERMREFEVVTSGSDRDRLEPRAEQLRREVQTLAAEIEGFERELNDLGIELKDYSLGLIDFPAELNGRMVYLCWRLGEPSVRFWHEPATGYRGRRPLYPAVNAGTSPTSTS